MALSYVSLVLDLYDGQGNPVTTGTVTLSPNATVLDASDHIVVTRKPVVISLFQNPVPTVSLVATDNSGLSPSGWGWLIQPVFPGAPDGQVYELLFASGATQYMSGLLPATAGPLITTYATGAALAAEVARAEAAEAVLTGNIPSLPVSLAHGGTGQTSAAAAITALTGTQTAGKYLRSDGTNAALAVIQAGDVPTLNQSTTGSAASANALNSATTTVGVSAATAPTSGQVLTATSGTAATWQTISGGGGGGIAPPAGDIGGSAGTPTVVATHLSSALPVNQGGTGAATLTGLVTGNGTSAMTAVTAPSGAVVGTSDTQTLTAKRVSPRVATLTVSSATYTPAGDTTDLALIASPTADFTVAAPTGTPVDGQKLMLRITSSGTGRTPTWNSAYLSSGIATLPASALPASKTVTLGFTWDASPSKWVLLALDGTGY